MPTTASRSRIEANRQPSTRGDRDRPTRQAAWPGEESPSIQEVKFDDRDEEFVDFVIAQVRKRQEAEDEFFASLGDDEGP